MKVFHSASLLFAVCLLPGLRRASAEATASDYAAIHQIFAKHCLDCHASQDPEAKLVLESFDSLMKGGENGPALVPGKSDESLIIKMVEGRVERDGKNKIMPPGKRAKLAPEEIVQLKAWIDSGAPGPAPGSVVVQTLVVPKVPLNVPPRRSIHSVAYAAGPKLLAVGRYQEVELLSSESRAVVRRLSGNLGSVNALVFAPDGKRLFAAGGEAGRFGEVREWNVPDGSLIRTLEGHKDAIYALALSPDGQTLATGSYDQKIKLWNVDSGSELKTLSGHNGSIFDLAFRPDGRILASASADRTVKLWDVTTGERRDTLSQSLKEVFTLAFSSDGKRLLAAGADNRIRIWEISDKALETTNPLLESRFAHDGSILKLAFASDGKTVVSAASDQTVKLWNAADLQERVLFETQPDWVSSLTFASENKAVVIGRLDGSLEFYDPANGHPLPLPKPELARTEPRGIERGSPVQVKLIGSNLVALTGVKFSDSRIKADLGSASSTNSNEVWISVTAPSDLPRGAYPLSVSGASGESGRVSLQVDDLPQIYLHHDKNQTASHTLDRVPVTVWDTFENSGETAELTFEAHRGDALVFDVAAERLGSKAAPVVTLFDGGGRVLDSSNGYDEARDPLLVHSFKSDGQYRLRVNELTLSASPDHFFRLSVGSFPYVTGCFPLSAPVGKDSTIELIGYNLPADGQVTVHPEKVGEMTLPLDLERFRTHRDLKLIVSDNPELVETEPNNTPEQAMTIVPPCAVGGRLSRVAAISSPGIESTGVRLIDESSATGDSNRGQPRADVDYFRFQAKAGQKWVIETAAAQRGSPADTRIEVLHPDGKPVERLVLQAVRDSSVTFRGIDSDTTDCRVVNWEEMELNQFLYLQGEVVKLFRAPQGPDSGFLFYSSHGKRRCYFDTSPAAHSLDEPCYIVEPHQPGEKLVATGLPVFPIYYENDDDGERKLGTDSKVEFTVPADGPYLVRVTEARGFGGDRFVYRLVLRPADPDFNVHLNGSNLTVDAGGGQEFSLEAERLDGFEGEISVGLGHLPAGFLVSTPLVIEAGHTEAKGTIHAALDAPKPTAEDWAKVEVTASASVDGRAFVKKVNNFGEVRLGDQPKLFVTLEPEGNAALSVSLSTERPVPASTSSLGSVSAKPLEITIAPGQTMPARLRVERHGYDDLITFTVENLPHGVIVDNIGLNGVLIPKGQNEREIFLSAAKWVPDTDRLCYAIESQAGRQTSLPVLLHVHRNRGLQAAVR
jgi:WD40 repeat protein